MKWNSIVTKLWLAITVLMLIVIAIAGVVQTSFIEKVYYQQQSKQLMTIAEKVAGLAQNETDTAKLDEKVAVVSDMMDGNIMIIDKDGTVFSCQGMGTSTKDMLMDINNPHHSPLTAEDLDKLFSGETVIHKGKNEYFKTDVLSVAMPVSSPQGNAGAVIIHSPLKPLAGQLASLKITTLYSIISGLILGTILMLFFSRMVSKPLLDMNRVALAMASGDFSRQVHVNSNDEISLLANSLNTLSSRLEEKLFQLDRLDKTRREFVANVSHEMKTPLTIIQGFTEALQDDIAVNEKEKKVYLQNISEEVVRLKRLVKDVLDLKKMEEGYYDHKKEQVDLNDIGNSLLKKFSAMTEQAGINLEINISKKASYVFGNKDMLEQVFINLTENALRHTPQGGKVTISTSLKSDRVHIQVRDNGSGILAEDLPMIWERFYKADKSRTRGQGGTGLGLAIVKRIIEAHKGCINVQSEPRKGTTFIIILPVNEWIPTQPV